QPPPTGTAARPVTAPNAGAVCREPARQQCPASVTSGGRIVGGRRPGTAKPNVRETRTYPLRERERPDGADQPGGLGVPPGLPPEYRRAVLRHGVPPRNRVFHTARPHRDRQPVTPPRN